jgi:Zn-finger protein
VEDKLSILGRLLAEDEEEKAEAGREVHFARENCSYFPC